jgi:hypothetical protein
MLRDMLHMPINLHSPNQIPVASILPADDGKLRAGRQCAIGGPARIRAAALTDVFVGRSYRKDRLPSGRSYRKQAPTIWGAAVTAKPPMSVGLSELQSVLSVASDAQKVIAVGSRLSPPSWQARRRLAH